MDQTGQFMLCKLKNKVLSVFLDTIYLKWLGAHLHKSDDIFVWWQLLK